MWNCDNMFLNGPYSAWVPEIVVGCGHREITGIFGEHFPYTGRWKRLRLSLEDYGSQAAEPLESGQWREGAKRRRILSLRMTATNIVFGTSLSYWIGITQV